MNEKQIQAILHILSVFGRFLSTSLKEVVLWRWINSKKWQL